MGGTGIHFIVYEYCLKEGGCRDMGMSTEQSGGGYREEGLKICRTPMGRWGPLGALSGAMSIDE